MRAVERAQLLRNLACPEEEVRHIAHRMIRVEELERRRISQELHDELEKGLRAIKTSDLARYVPRFARDPFAR